MCVSETARPGCGQYRGCDPGLGVPARGKWRPVLSFQTQSPDSLSWSPARRVRKGRWYWWWSNVRIEAGWAGAGADNGVTTLSKLYLVVLQVLYETDQLAITLLLCAILLASFVDRKHAFPGVILVVNKKTEPGRARPQAGHSAEGSGVWRGWQSGGEAVRCSVRWCNRLGWGGENEWDGMESCRMGWDGAW